MLHWHPWWMHTADGSSRTPTNPLAPNETAWSPEQWLEAPSSVAAPNRLSVLLAWTAHVSLHATQLRITR